jgi:predicted kinase
MLLCSSIAKDAPFTIFLLSPANLGGERAALVFNPKAEFPLARELRSPEGAPVGKLFSFVSGLYFRGKMTYAEAFGRAPGGLSGALVISPAEGLRFLHERVTVERLRGWASVDIDAENPRFTQPLLEHAAALVRAFSDEVRFVLLGSVATDKYVQPLSKVFGKQLLFPPDFAGRGDMSRGALLLRAARAGQELEYAPILGAQRHGPRPAAVSANSVVMPAGVADLPVATPAEVPAAVTDVPDMVLFVGLPGAGKSTFFRQRFAATHVHVSKDNLRNHRQPARRQQELLRQALVDGRSVVVDNTNASVEERAELIAEARRQGARTIGYFFDATARECVARNREREGRARIPAVGIFATAKRLVPPAREEDFDEIHTVRTLPEQCFQVTLLHSHGLTAGGRSSMSTARGSSATVASKALPLRRST